MTTEVGSAQVAIIPTFLGFRKAVDKEVAGATAGVNKSFNKGFTKTAQQSGTAAGKGFTQGFTTNSSDLGVASLKTLQAQVAKTTQANSRARLAEQDAVGKVNVAQAALNATIGKYAAGSPQFVRATENLASAQRKASASGDTLKLSFDSMKTAQANLKKATEETSGAVQKQGGFFSGFSNLGSSLLGGLKSGIAGGIGLAVSGIEAIVKAGLVVAAAGGIAIGAALTAGFSRLTTIETAQAKLKALGNTSADVAEIMKDANDAVLGTQYSLADAVTAAASATAAGIKPGKELTKYLKLQANAAAVAGVGFSDLGLVMNQVQSQGKAYTQDLNQVASRGIPIYQSLQKVFGVTQDKLRDMVANGEVDSAHFREALTLNVGNAAEEIGKTTEGSFENAKAAVSRFGAVLAAPIFPAAKAVFTGIKDALDKMGAALKPIIEKYGPKLQEAFKPVADSIGPAFDKLVDKFVSWVSSPDGEKFLGQLAVNFQLIGDAIVKALPSITSFIESTGKLVADGLLFASAVAPSMIDSFAKIADGASKIGSNLDTAFQKVQDGTFMDTVGAKFSNGWDQIVEGFRNGGQQIGDFFANDWTILMGKFGNGWDQIVTFFGDDWGKLVGQFQNGGAQIASFASSLWANVSGAFSNGAKQIGGFFSGLWKTVTDAVGNAGNWLVQTGKDVVQGFINGIAKLAPTIGRAFLNLVPEFIRGPFEAALGIHSPSKVFFDNGVYTGQGYINGVESMTNGVKKAVTSLVSVPTTTSPSSSTSSSASRSGTPYVETMNVITPDPNPVVAGRIIGREFLRTMAGV